MNIENLSEGAEDFTGNVWMIQNGENVLVDAGTGDVWNQIKRMESIDKVVVTHSHYDHVDNLPKILDKYSPEVYSYRPENLPVEAKKIEENINIADLEFEVIHTPGHKDDSICLYSPEAKILFTGDLIFPKGSFGRTDLEEGDRELLIRSIEEIANLEVESFYPGHENAVESGAEEQIKRSLAQAREREQKY